MKTKKQLLRVLFLEENKTTIDQVENVLNDSFHKFSAKTARTEKEFLKYVIRFNPDVIIAGYRLEKYSAGEAFDLLKAENYRIPFFLIADNLSEEVSRALIKSGVEDCLIISNLTTLPISILKILEKNKINLEKDEVENQLKYKEERLQTIFKKEDKTHDRQSEITKRRFDRPT